jgi:hypothetical protein
MSLVDPEDDLSQYFFIRAASPQMGVPAVPSPFFFSLQKRKVLILREEPTLKVKHPPHEKSLDLPLGFVLFQVSLKNIVSGKISVELTIFVVHELRRVSDRIL